jgi:hypothetical protein
MLLKKRGDVNTLCMLMNSTNNLAMPKVVVLLRPRVTGLRVSHLHSAVFTPMAV